MSLFVCERKRGSERGKEKKAQGTDLKIDVCLFPAVRKVSVFKLSESSSLRNVGS